MIKGRELHSVITAEALSVSLMTHGFPAGSQPLFIVLLNHPFGLVDGFIYLF